MAKRTNDVIKKDYVRCKQYLDRHPKVTSLKEIAKAVNLSESKVKTSLMQDSKEFEKIMKKISENNSNEKHATKVVIDASITGVEGFNDIINKILENKNVIVLTTITIRELGKLQKYNDICGRDARNVLSMAAGNQKDFECVRIEETLNTPDDCIIKYCADNKSQVILYTSDKTMSLKARAYGVKTKFLQQPRNRNERKFTKRSQNKIAYGKKAYNKRATLHEAKKTNGELIIKCFVSELKSIKVISDGIQYHSGNIALKRGDNIYIAKRKDDYIFFLHYEMISNEEEDNCKIIYCKKIYNKGQIKDLPKEKYKSFLREFWICIN